MNAPGRTSVPSACGGPRRASPGRITVFRYRPRVGQLLNEHKDALWSELSYRGGVAGGDGKLTSDWRSLFESYSFDFLLGSDTRINERWFDYDKIFKEYRNWLAQISLEQARRIASGNALRLFGPQARN